MSRSSIEIEELLTGLIDGQLSDAERRDVESRLERDDSAQKLLRTLQRNRKSIADLPQVASPRFDSRIVALAQERAKRSSAPGWLSPPSVRRASKQSQIWRKHGLVLGLAASLAMVAVGAVTYVMLLEGSGNGQGAIANITNPQAPEEHPGQGGSEQTAPQIVQNNVPSEQPVDRIPNVPDKAPSVDPATVASNNSSVIDPIVTTAVPKQDSNSLPEVNPKVENSVASVDNNAEDLAGAYLTIIDVTVAKDSDALEALSETLARFDIAVAEDLNVDQTMIDRLERARLTNGPLSDQRRAEGAESTSLVFVKARASRIDGAVEEIMSMTELYPEISWDLAFEPSEVELFQQLRHVQEAKLPRAQQGEVAISVASPLRAENASRAFAGMSRRQQPMQKSARTDPNRAPVVNASNEISHLLFVVRTAK